MRSGQSGAGCHPTALAVQAIACLASDSHERLGGGWFEITLAASRHHQPRQPRQSHQNVRRPHGVRIAACRRATRGRRANPPDPPIRDPQRHNETENVSGLEYRQLCKAVLINSAWANPSRRASWPSQPSSIGWGRFGIGQQARSTRDLPQQRSSASQLDTSAGDARYRAQRCRLASVGGAHTGRRVGVSTGQVAGGRWKGHCRRRAVSSPSGFIDISLKLERCKLPAPESGAVSADRR